MKIANLFLCCMMLFVFSYGQSNTSPRNIKQAIRWLDRGCPDSLKSLIVITPDEQLEKLFYPNGGKCEHIFKWTTGDENRMLNFLKEKGIESHTKDVILVAYKRHLAGLPINEAEIYKPYVEIERNWKAEDKIRDITDTLRGIYIPKNLNDCFVRIDSMFADTTKQTIKKWNEDEMWRLHHGFGMWMRNNWQLWGGSRLSVYFNNLDIHHPDDMSGLILTSYHRYLNNKPIEIDSQVSYYQEYWKKMEKQSIQNEMDDLSVFEIGDTVEYRNKLGFVSKKQEKRFDSGICYAYGIVTGKDSTTLKLRVLLLESCDRRGIIYYDNKDYRIYDSQTKEWTKPAKRIIKYMKKGDELWLDFRDWLY